MVTKWGPNILFCLYNRTRCFHGYAASQHGHRWGLGNRGSLHTSHRFFPFKRA
jgi:hypothetical protein